MAGIISYGAYIPIYRLSKSEIARMWEKGPRKGEKAVANSDEDSITMAVEAVIDCLRGRQREHVDALWFATTTPPYREKQSASIIAAAADLRRDILTGDITDSLRGGTIALQAALDAVSAGSAKQVLVVCSDCRVPAPNSAFEPIFGDGAAALLIGGDNAAVQVEARHRITSEFLDIWKTDSDDYIRSWEDRFILKGFEDHIREVVEPLLRKCDLSPRDLSKVALYAPDSRTYARMLRVLGIDKAQVTDPMFDTVGNTGAAFAMMQLVASLENAQPGDRVLLVGYGDGCDAFMLHVTDHIKNIGERRGIKENLKSKMMLSGYGKYVRFRNLMEWEKTPAPERPISPVSLYWRDREALLRGRGVKCKKCGHLQFPPQRVCTWCHSKDAFEGVRISGKIGELFTYSKDERALWALDLPNILSVVNLEGGGRFYGQMTDRDADKVEIGMPIELTLRKIHEGSGFYNYSWKCRPKR
ncbi:MAG: 3-oxoacyl-[acyl-carrier-protein] synthase III C-terminal domain-containing protein [Thermodesulfobacteriota bacterium]|nr:3-oxoacyl-[acyl-carrier-protein] synthase III C-terminal domain-containing protein [Thermodesulfobacteriota bacterium]